MKKKPHVFIALLSYTGQVWISTMQSLLNDIADLQTRGCEVAFKSLIGCTYIHAARSQMATMFLESDATHLMFIDWDIVWSSGDIARLMNHDVDVVAADYPRRREPIKYNARFLECDGKWNDQITQDGLLEVQGVPTGFMLIRRSVIEKMVAAYPELEFIEDTVQPPIKAHMLFGHLFGNNTLLSDDYSFCDRWREIGGKVFVDTKITIGHIGSKMFVGEYERWLGPTLKLPVGS